jgi:hypothetical protein
VKLIFRHATRGGHVHIGVWSGNGTVGKNGDLIFTADEWDTFRSTILDGARQNRQLVEFVPIPGVPDNVTLPAGQVGILTADEHRAMELTAELWDAVAGLAGEGSPRNSDLAELRQHIHAVQHTILAQAAARAYPDRYRLLGWPVTR